MKIRRKALAATLEPLEDRQVRLIVSTDQVDRVGDIVVQKGIDLGPFRATKTVLWNHDQNKPIAACLSIALEGEQLASLVQFPPEGVSALADEIYGLIKAGVINAASIGYLPIVETAIVAGQPRKGVRIEQSQLLEFSFVSVPANPGALITSRSLGKGAMKVTIKGLYQVGQLAYLLDCLGDTAMSAKWEAEYEGDGSTVPAMLVEALRQVGQALVAMTEEEVAELLAGHDVDDVEIETRATPFARLVAKSLDATRFKAGRTFSKSNADGMRQHCGAVKDAADAMLKMVDEAEPGDADEDGTAAEKRLALASKAQRQKDIRDLAIGVRDLAHRQG